VRKGSLTELLGKKKAIAKIPTEAQKKRFKSKRVLKREYNHFKSGQPYALNNRFGGQHDRRLL